MRIPSFQSLLLNIESGIVFHLVKPSYNFLLDSHKPHRLYFDKMNIKVEFLYISEALPFIGHTLLSK